MFENVETKCPSVTPSIPYKSIAVIQYITSSQKQEKNSLIFLWKESAHQNNRKMTKFKLPAHREEVEEFFNFMDRDYDGNLSFEVFSSCLMVFFRFNIGNFGVSCSRFVLFLIYFGDLSFEVFFIFVCFSSNWFFSFSCLLRYFVFFFSN